MFKILVCESVVTRKCLSRLPSVAASSHHPFTLQNHQPRRNFTQNFWLTLSASKPVAIFQEATIQLHDISGMPWWSTIIVSTFLLRGCVTFPLALYQNKILSKVERISKEEMPEIAKELTMETSMAVKKFNWDEKTAKIMFAASLKKQYKNLLVRDNCHPAKSLVLILFQIPLWITQSCALRNMISMLPDPSNVNAQIVCAEMSLGGFLWIPNLIEPDQSFILPIFLGILNLAIVEVSLMILNFE
jgi:mitochondrial inner membrane protein COX18